MIAAEHSVDAERAFGAAIAQLSFDSPLRCGANDGMLTCGGKQDNRVVVVAETMTAFWRTFTEALSAEVREVSDFDGVLICDEVRS